MSERISPQGGPQEQFLQSSADIVIYGGSAGGGKAQPMSSKVSTPFGFRDMGSLTVGSLVNNPDGTVAKVLNIYPQGMKEVYRVVFSDGSETKCTGDHLWLISYTGQRVKADRKYIGEKSVRGRIETTDNIIKHLEKQKGKNRKTYPTVPLTEPVIFTRAVHSDVPFPVDPYVLGLLLGDGHMSNETVMLTTVDDEISEYFCNNVGYSVSKMEADGRAGTFRVSDPRGIFRRTLRHIGVYGHLSYTKFVPDLYKYASVEYRYEMLRGLLDTDGTVDKRGHVSFCSVSERLSKDVKWLVESLGGRGTITEGIGKYKKDGKYIECNKFYSVYIQHKRTSELFKLARKKDRCVDGFNGENSELRRRIVKIVKCDDELVQCIQVDHPNGLYLTDDFIVTHNTFGLLLECLRHMDNPQFGAVIFRRTHVQTRAKGGLWDASSVLYPRIGGIPKESSLGWVFGSKATVKFAHLEYEKNVYDWQGSEIPLICFDELTHFTENMFFYMLSRNRSTCGVKPYIRATCNPDSSHFLVVGPNGWGSGLISWWIDADGFPIPDRSGAVRWFVRYNDVLKFADTKEELSDMYPGLIPKSLTFIPSKLSDNKILEEADPGYRANLMALSSVERSRLLDGNWKVQPASGMYFKREWFTDMFIPTAPAGMTTVRAWDLAATEVTPTSPNPDWTAGIKMGVKNGTYYIMDMRSGRLNSLGVENLVRNTAQSDGLAVHVVIEQEPGGSGKSLIDHFRRNVLSGYKLEGVTSTKNKELRAQAVSAAIESGKIQIVSGDWNHALFDQLEPFPDPKVHDDFVDALSSAFNYLSQRASGNYAGFSSPGSKSNVPQFGGGRGGLPGL